MNPFQLKKFLQKNNIDTTRKNMRVYLQSLKIKDFLDTSPDSPPSKIINFYIRNFGFFKISNNQNNDLCEYKNVDDQKIYTGKKIRDHVRHRLEIVRLFLKDITRNLKRFQTSKVSPKSDNDNHLIIDSNTSDFFNLLDELGDLHPNLPLPEIKKENVKQSKRDVSNNFLIVKEYIGKYYLDIMKKVRNSFIEDEKYRNIVKNFSKDGGIFLRLVGKAKFMQPIWGALCNRFRDFTNETWLKEHNNKPILKKKLIDEAIYSLAQLVKALQPLKLKKIHKKKVYEKDYDSDEVRTFYLDCNKNVEWTLNKFCGLHDKEGREKLLSVLKEVMGDNNIKIKLSDEKKVKGLIEKHTDLPRRTGMEKIIKTPELTIVGFANKQIESEACVETPIETPVHKSTPKEEIDMREVDVKLSGYYYSSLSSFKENTVYLIAQYTEKYSFEYFMQQLFNYYRDKLEKKYMKSTENTMKFLYTITKETIANYKAKIREMLREKEENEKKWNDKIQREILEKQRMIDMGLI